MSAGANFHKPLFTGLSTDLQQKRVNTDWDYQSSAAALSKVLTESMGCTKAP